MLRCRSIKRRGAHVCTSVVFCPEQRRDPTLDSTLDHADRMAGDPKQAHLVRPLRAEIVGHLQSEYTVYKYNYSEDRQR